MPRRNARVSSDEEDYQPPTQSQGGGGTQLSHEEITQLAGLVCNFLLVAECKKIPAKRLDIKKLVLKDRGRHFNTIMSEATEIMERVFGYKIKELQNGNYIMVNTLGLSAGEGSCGTANQAARSGLLTAILAAIFMTGDKMQEDVMQEYLKTLGVDMQSKEPHPLLGNIFKLIHQDLVREKYLEVSQDQHADPPSQEYRWGERAHLELPKKDILELVCKVYGDNMRPEVWTSQWKEVEKETASQETS